MAQHIHFHFKGSEKHTVPVADSPPRGQTQHLAMVDQALTSTDLKKVEAVTPKKYPPVEVKKYKTVRSQFAHLIADHILPALKAGKESKGAKIDVTKTIGELKHQFAKWLSYGHGGHPLNSEKSGDGPKEKWVEYRIGFLRLLKKKTPPSLYKGIKKAFRQLEELITSDPDQYNPDQYDATDPDERKLYLKEKEKYDRENARAKYVEQLIDALGVLRTNHTNGAGNATIVTEIALRFGIDEDELAYFWDKALKEVSTKHPELKKEVKELEIPTDKQESDIGDPLLRELIEKDKRFRNIPVKILELIRRMRGEHGHPEYIVMPEDWRDYDEGADEKRKDVQKLLDPTLDLDTLTEEELEDRKTLLKNLPKAKREEYERQRADIKNKVTREKKDKITKMTSRLESLWITTERLLPRAFADKISNWRIHLDMDGSKIRTLTTNRAGNRILPDQQEKLFVVPTTIVDWDNKKIMDAYIDAVVRAFFYETKLMEIGKIGKFLDSVFINTKDVDLLVDFLNALVDGSIDDKGQSVPFVRVKPLVEELEDELKTIHNNVDRIVALNTWRAEHEEHFTALFKDRKMIPLFQKWVTDIIRARVHRSSIPDTVPYPVVNFVNKLASYDEVRETAAAQIAVVRMRLSNIAPEEIEMDRRLLEIHKMIRRRVRLSSLGGIPKVLQRTP